MGNFLDRTAKFAKASRAIRFFSHAGDPDPAYRILPDIRDALTVLEGDAFDLWSHHTHLVEERARTVSGDDEIDAIFAVVTEAIEERVRKGLEGYAARRTRKHPGEPIDEEIWGEVVDAVLRDFSWAAVEHALDEPRFFKRLVPIYEAGRWPCGWDGKYPGGRAVVL